MVENLLRAIFKSFFAQQGDELAVFGVSLPFFTGSVPQKRLTLWVTAYPGCIGGILFFPTELFSHLRVFAQRNNGNFFKIAEPFFQLVV